MQAEPMLPNQNPGAGEKFRTAAVCLGLLLLTALVFGRTAAYPFVNFDDGYYVYQNPLVARGLSFSAVGWIFTHADCSLYHPLTMLSFLWDYQLHELNAEGYHWTNCLLHGASVVILFLVLRTMTGAFWRSAFVAAVFAIHPLRVESVAWVSERKDVLSVFFFVLTLAAYVRFTRQPRSVCRYLLVVLAFAAALLSKPSVVTLPFLLLLLDYWPLVRRESWGRLVLEKIPLLALSVADSVITVVAATKEVHSYAFVPLAARLANAAVSCWVYVRQLFWPARLTVYYPRPANGYGPLSIVASILFIASVSALALAWRRKRPWFGVGWFWYLGMLTPMLGLVQAGAFAHADRMTYLTEIGLCMALTWLAAEVLRNNRIAGALGCGVIIALAAGAWQQTQYWRSSRALWERAIACTTDNAMAHYNLGVENLEQNREPEAAAEFQKTLAINPGHSGAANNLGNIYLREGKTQEAIAAFQIAVKSDSEIKAVHFNLAMALQKAGSWNDAAAEYEADLKIDPTNSDAHFNLATLLQARGQYRDAVLHYAEALRLKPDDPSVENRLAWVYATCPDPTVRNGMRALELSTQANELTGGGRPVILSTMAASLAELGRFAEASATAQRALDLAVALDRTELARALREQLSFYKAARPFRVK
jgi:tetratricopeptide (TPR) repeat protein